MRQVSFQLALPKQQSAVAPEGVRTNRGEPASSTCAPAQSPKLNLYDTDMDPTPEGDRTWDAWAWLSVRVLYL